MKLEPDVSNKFNVFEKKKMLVIETYLLTKVILDEYRSTRLLYRSRRNYKKVMGSFAISKTTQKKVIIILITIGKFF